MGQLDSIRDYSSPKTDNITPAYIEKTYSYDNNGRTTGISARSSSGITVESFTYTYDNNGQILTKKHVNNLLEQAAQKASPTAVSTRKQPMNTLTLERSVN